MLRSIFFSLATQTAIGLIFTVAFISLSEIGKFFFRVTTLIALILIVLALIANPFGNVVEFGTQITYLCFIGSVALILLHNLGSQRFHRPMLLAAIVFGFLGIAIFSLTFNPAARTISVNPVFVTAGALGSSLLSGSVLGAMITGHWYLIEHKLNIASLKNSSLIYLCSVIFKTVLAVVTFFLYMKGHSLAFLQTFSFQSLIFLCRYIVGLFIPLVLGMMVWKTVKIHSTQSATGILYAIIVLVFLGEAFGQFIYFATGLP